MALINSLAEVRPYAFTNITYILAKCKWFWKSSIVNPFPTPENWGQWGHGMQIFLHMVSWLATPVSGVGNWFTIELFQTHLHFANILYSLYVILVKAGLTSARLPYYLNLSEIENILFNWRGVCIPGFWTGILVAVVWWNYWLYLSDLTLGL